MLAVVDGRAHDRVPFVQYDGIAAPNDEVWALVGRGKMGLLRWSRVHRTEHPSCAIERREFDSREPERDGPGRRGLRGTRTIIHTPEGDLTQETLREPTYGTASVKRHFVREPEDYRALAAYLRDAVVLPDFERFERDRRELGDDGLPHAAVDRTPFQQLWVEWAGIEGLAFHLVDCPGKVEECVALMGAILRRQFDVAARSDAPYLVFPDNLTAPVIGERNFGEYCVPYYDELAGMLEGRGALVYVHADGDLAPLWGAIGESRVRGLDSLSPPPDNDTPVARAAAMWPKMRLGVNFPSSVHLAGPEAVYERARGILDEAGSTGRLQIQISENVPPGAWRRSFPEIVRAIDEFGTPAG